MKSGFAALALVATLAPHAMAQTADDDLKALMTGYVQAFNRGDATALANDFYQSPGDRAARFAEKIDALRREDFGKLDLYGFETCTSGPELARVKMTFAYVYTFGGLMPPGDQAMVFDLARTADGWRISAEADTPFDAQLSCEQ